IRIVRRSTVLMVASFRAAHPASHRRETWPTTNGRTSQIMRSITTSESAWPPPAAAPRYHSTQRGVSATPITLESVALNTAAGTLPFAAAVRAIDDETVDGNAQR